MAIIDGLVTLVDVKLLAGIASGDTSKDTLLESLINSASKSVQTFLDRKLKRATYTSETYAVNNHQNLYLREYPIQSVTSVYLAGSLLSSGSGYFLSGLDAEAGRLYRPMGWCGSYYSRGTFPDAFAGAREIVVTYIAGYYFPADVGYAAGAVASVPLDISQAVANAVVSRMRKQGGEGLASLTEYSLSYSWFGPESYIDKNGGFDQVTASALLAYKRRDL